MKIIATIELYYAIPVKDTKVEHWIQTKSFDSAEPIQNIFDWANRCNAVNIILSKDEE